MAVVITAGAVDLDREGRDPAYVESYCETFAEDCR